MDCPAGVVTDNYDIVEDDELWARIGIDWSERSERSERSGDGLDNELWARIGIDWSERSERSERSGDGLDKVDKLDSETVASPTQRSTSLPPELLRATPLYEALSGWCRHWQGSDSEVELFHFSRPVNSIDVFLNLGVFGVMWKAQWKAYEGQCGHLPVDLKRFFIPEQAGPVAEKSVCKKTLLPYHFLTSISHFS